ncbi:amidophosphoribosyltransferase [Helicobacter magdeburgensis]|uniref:Amidophosphoribosyltransferase n=1 Tax=Helicobacter magdeburgensis TaxID=471858 RepID=A0A4U8T0J0_9HELI|nr:amidophosphoribosyltransferase [Helicobacter magdeburgensis]TLD92871.1 amidophosphoribosyltransferase [Helicobacter magdeburgensis]
MKHWNEECAVVGVYNVENASILSYYSLFAMQHRGQEASGISASNGSKIATIKNTGLVTKIFTEKRLSKLQGRSSIGHNRYSTAGEDSINDTQPIFARYDLGEMAIAHNGNLTNAKQVRQMLINEGAIFQSHLDTENLIHLIARSKKQSLTDRIIDALGQVDGAYCFIFLSRTKMFAIRDRYGLRPLSLGKIQNQDGSTGYIVASESCAFDLVGAEFVREVRAGEMLIFDGAYSLSDNQPKSIQVFEPKEHPCVFEHVYFARPDSNVFGHNVYKARKQMGIELAKEHKIEADMVIPVPDSGVAAALGYSKQSGIDFELGLIRNHYVGRTFIEPTQQQRELKVRLKLNPIAELIAGKDIIVIDDSVVRGTTSKQIIKILRQAGARKIHLLISSPPTISPCFYGVDTPHKTELICANKSIEEVRKYIGADSLGFLSIDGLMRSLGDENKPMCKACFDEVYIDDFTNDFRNDLTGANPCVSC